MAARGPKPLVYVHLVNTLKMAVANCVKPRPSRKHSCHLIQWSCSKDVFILHEITKSDGSVFSAVDTSNNLNAADYDDIYDTK